MTKKFVIIAEYGIHARPATRLVHEAMKYESEIIMNGNGKSVNLKSIMGVMSLGIYNGENVSITVSGEDEQQAMDAMTRFIIEEKLGRPVNE